SESGPGRPPLYVPPLQCQVRLPAERSDTFVQAGEALVPGVSADVAGVNLLNDDGDLVDPEAIVEQHAGHVADGPGGVPGDQFLSGEAAGQGRRPDSIRVHRFRVARLDPVA